MKRVEVVAGVILADGKVLATQRGYGPEKGGWEFPGGKVEDGETPEEALVRELREELDLRVLVGESIGSVPYDSKAIRVRITYYLCWVAGGGQTSTRTEERHTAVCQTAGGHQTGARTEERFPAVFQVAGGALTLREASDAKWLSRFNLESVDWLPADREILPAVKNVLPPLSILCYGDSNTYGFNPKSLRRYGEDVRWPKVLAGLLGEDFRVIEEGCNGRTAAYIPADSPWKNGAKALTSCLNSHKPTDLLILMLGTNDLKKSFHPDPLTITEAIRQMVLMAKDFTGKKQDFPANVLLISPPEILPGIVQGPFKDNFDENAPQLREQLPALYREVAETTECLFLDAAGIAQVSPKDCLHLSEEGHRRLAQAVFEKLHGW